MLPLSEPVVIEAQTRGISPFGTGLRRPRVRRLTVVFVKGLRTLALVMRKRGQTCRAACSKINTIRAPADALVPALGHCVHI